MVKSMGVKDRGDFVSLPLDKRDISIDRFRGLAVFLMIVLETLCDFDNMGYLSRLGKHSPIDGITVVEGMQFMDVIAPMFLFAVAITYKASFERRSVLCGKKFAVKHFLGRYLSLIGIGGVLQSLETFILFIAQGCLEETIDYFFLSGLFLFIVVIIGVFVSYVVKQQEVKRIFSKLLFLIIIYFAIMCIFSTIRDFFSQIFYEHINGFEPWGYWEALQAIGAAGLVSLLFINFSTAKRVVVTTALLLFYAGFHQVGNNADIIAVYAQQGGFFGVLGQSCILLYGTILADLYYQNTVFSKKYIKMLLAFGVFAFISMCFVLPTMRSVSPSYILLNTFISGTVFLFICCWKNVKLKFDLFELLGKNSIIIYILQYILINGIKEIIGYDVIKNASVFSSVLITFIIIGILIVIAYMLDKKKIFVKL